MWNLKQITSSDGLEQHVDVGTPDEFVRKSGDRELHLLKTGKDIWKGHKDIGCRL